MFRLVWINIEKRLNKSSLIFIFLAIIFVWLIAFYNASFNLSTFDFISNKKVLIKDYIYETSEVFTIILFFLVLLLNIQEVTIEMDRFDSYFVCLFSKRIVFWTKICAMVIMQISFMFVLFIGIILIYIIRFQELNQLSNLMIIFFNNFFYFTFILLLSFIIVTLFKNQYSLLSIIVIYWLSKLTVGSKIDNVLKYLILRIDYNYEKCYSSLGVSYTYIIWYIIGLSLLTAFIYQKKDLNC